MRTRTALGIAVVGGLALAAGRSVGLDQRVRDAARGLIPPTVIERPAEKQISGDIPLNELLTRENFAENPYYVDFYHTNTEARRNEDPYTEGQTARFYLHIGARPSEVRAFVLYEDNLAIRVWDETILPDGNTSKEVEISREKGLHTYELRVWDNAGKMVKSRPIRIDYSGKFKDLAPTFSIDDSFIVGEDFLAIRYFVDDKGDNPGIDSVTVYENGRIVKVLKDVVANDFGGNEILITDIKPGAHQFKFTAKDRGGNIVESGLPINFETGPYQQPKIERIK